MAGLLKEIWLPIIMEQYSQEPSFLDMVDNDMSALVDNNVINLAEAGLDPEVLVNNTTYPIPTEQREDTPFVLPLDYFDTKNTVIRNAEAMQLAYDKMASVTIGHARALKLKTAGKASHAYTPGQNSTYNPVVATTGADNGSSFKLITEDDVIKLAERFDEVDAPDNRVLVLHTKHWNELLRSSQTLKEQRYRAPQGTLDRVILEFAGFRITRFRSDAIFNKGTGVKKAWGAAAAPSTDTISSFAFVSSEVMKASGTTDMFSRLKDPDERGDKIGFQQFFLGMPMRNKYTGAIYSAAV